LIDGLLSSKPFRSLFGIPSGIFTPPIMSGIIWFWPSVVTSTLSSDFLFFPSVFGVDALCEPDAIDALDAGRESGSLAEPSSVVGAGRFLADFFGVGTPRPAMPGIGRPCICISCNTSGVMPERGRIIVDPARFDIYMHGFTAFQNSRKSSHHSHPPAFQITRRLLLILNNRFGYYAT
jgi:hypothetical protein